CLRRSTRTRRSGGRAETSGRGARNRRGGSPTRPRLRPNIGGHVFHAATQTGGSGTRPYEVSSLRPGIALQAAFLDLGEILRPQRLAVAADLVEVLPRVDAGVVQVVERDADRVVADRLELENAYVLAAGHDLLLRGPVP